MCVMIVYVQFSSVNTRVDLVIHHYIMACNIVKTSLQVCIQSKEQTSKVN